MTKILLFLILCCPVFAQEIEAEMSFWQKVRDMGPLIKANIAGYFDNLGLTINSSGERNLPSWKAIGISVGEDMLFESCRSVDCDVYYRDLALVSDARISHAKKTKLLHNLESFHLREKLILEAKKSIYISTWGIRSDNTGNSFLNWIRNALEKNPKLDVRIIVDGNQSTTKEYGKLLLDFKKEMGEKIKLLRWNHKNYRSHVNHRKFMVVDSFKSIVGGTNVGDPYSHMFPTQDANGHWRDYDVYIEGKSSAITFHNLFVQMWNEQIENGKNPYEAMEVQDSLEQEDGIPLLLIDQNPGSSRISARHSIHSAIVKLFKDAKESIDIENAYFALDPVIARELTRIIKEKKVKVRIITNSKESVDEPIIAMPILKSARDAALAGAESFVKQGPTLHSKYMVIDNKITMIGSFNFSPRSLMFDAETVAVIFDENLALDYKKDFDSLINSGEAVLFNPRSPIQCDIGGVIFKLLCFDCI